MSARNLSKRLTYIRNESNKKGPHLKEKPKADAEVRSIVPEEWKCRGDYTFVREYDIPFSHPQKFHTAPLTGIDVPADRCVFFDTETTGLSGGAGTIAFLIGVGRFRSGTLRVTQYFLSDFPGEEEMLRSFADCLDDDNFYLSYNGRAFDSHLLRSRFVLHRIKADLQQQIDLLYPSRRLWKNVLPSCTLSAVEDGVLGVRRNGDIPGRDVPDYYFAFLKRGTFALLESVFKHNLQDILSLGKLLLKFHTICESPLESDNLDPLALGKLFLENRDERGLAILQKEYDGGNVAAGLVLAGIYKRLRRWEEALFMWESLWQRGRREAPGLELAKYYEHKQRDYSKALAYVNPLLRNQSLPPSGDASRAALEHRKKRLSRKLLSTKYG